MANDANSVWAISLKEGQENLLSQFFALSERKARAVGVTLRLRDDFAALARIQQANRDTWPLVNPTFDSGFNRLDANCAYWIEGVDAAGRTVLANATRFFDWTDTTLADELRSLRAFYRDPAPHIAAGEFCDVPGDMAASVRGRTSTSGALWVRADHRRLGLASIIGRLSRACAYARWDIAYCWALTAQNLHELGLTRAYGHAASGVQPGVTIDHGARGRLAAVLTCQDREALRADLARIVREAALADADVAQGGRRQHQQIVSATPGEDQPIVT